MSILEHQSYRSYLQSLLHEKVHANPAYSLRAMAKKLELAPSYLSAILKGKKNLSPDRAYSVASHLNLELSEQQYFCLLVQMDATRNPALRESFLENAQQMNARPEAQSVNPDQFKMISDWYHAALIEATDLTEFSATPENLARLLGLSRTEVDAALARLIRLEILELDDEGRARKTKSEPRVVSENPNAALRKFHRQTLEMAIASLESQSPQEKVVGSETFAIDEDQIEEFHKLIDQFFDKALILAKKSKRRNAVYHLGVQFFNFLNAKDRGNKT